MKKTNNLLFPCIFLFLMAMSLCSCNKKSINGDLDGRWQIMEIELNGETVNKKDDQLYYNFYLHVCNLSMYGKFFTDGNMEYDGKTLWLQFPYANAEWSIELLKAYGIYTNPVTFTVEYIDRHKLILKEGDEIITLRKF